MEAAHGAPTHEHDTVRTTTHRLMTERQLRELASVTRTRVFLTRRPRLSSELAVIAKTLVQLEKRIAALMVTEQMRYAPDSVATVGRQANLLRERHMIPLARRGRLLFGGEPRLERALRVPHKRAPVGDVLTAARQMITAITPHKRLFVAAGASNTFLADFRSAVTRLATSVKVEARFKSVVPGARAELRRLLALARAEVRVATSLVPVWIETLDIGEQAGLAAAWRAAHRINARLGRPSARRVGHRKKRELRLAASRSAAPLQP